MSTLSTMRGVIDVNMRHLSSFTCPPRRNPSRIPPREGPIARDASMPVESASPSTSGAIPTRRRLLLRPRRLRLRRHVRPVRAAAGRRRLAGRRLGPARPRRQRPRRALLVGRRRPRRARGARHHDTDAGSGVGHSKGGGLMMQLAEALPHRVSHLVNLDGLPSKRRPPDVADHERTRLLANELEAWLDHRRGVADARAQARHARRAGRPPRPDEPAPVRGVAALPRQRSAPRHDADGWRWKLDPVDALRRLRPVASRVVAAAHARAVDAVPRRPRPRVRGDGLGHEAGRHRGLPARRRPVRDAGEVRPLRAHRTARRRRRPRSRAPGAS